MQPIRLNYRSASDRAPRLHAVGRMRNALLPLLACLALGCQFTHMNTDQASRPEQATGAGAQVMYPGESGPSLAGAGSGTAAGSGAGSQSTSGGDPDADMTLLGGSSGEASTSQRDRQMPIIGPLTALFGYPFWIFGKSVEEKAKQAAEEQSSQTGSSSGPERETAPRTPDEAQHARLLRENERIQQELLERSQSPSSSVAPGSLTDELAQLERTLSKRPGSQGTSGRHEGGLVPAQDVVDRNADGRPDLWIYYDGRHRVREVLDENHDGRADRVLHYQNGTTLVRAEEDLDDDGRIETVSIYEGGQVVRKRADSDADGQSDSWSFYQGGELIRHELDRNRDGFRDLVLVYEAGQLAREEEDRNGDGRPDLVTRYLNGELVERREDLDYDGTTDVASYYEGGKLVRRELTSEQVLEQWTDERGS